LTIDNTNHTISWELKKQAADFENANAHTDYAIYLKFTGLAAGDKVGIKSLVALDTDLDAVISIDSTNPVLKIVDTNGVTQTYSLNLTLLD
jgi:hypothetical protein